MPNSAPTIIAATTTIFLLCAGQPVLAQTGAMLQGKAAYGDWHTDSPGTRRLITPADLPVPAPAEVSTQSSQDRRAHRGAKAQGAEGI